MNRLIAQWILILMFCCSFQANCQLNKTAKPFTNKYLKEINSLSLPAIDQQLLKEVTENYLPYRYGISRNIFIDIKKESTITNLDSGRIYQYKIESLDALSIGIYFKKYFVPQKSQLFLCSEDQSINYGAFSELNNNPDSTLSIADFPGSCLILEYYEPNNSLFEGQLVIGRIIHGYKDIFANKSLKASTTDESPGINCIEGDKFQDIKHAVCKITFSDEMYSYMCSGSLINNTRNDGIPYYLTAAHCLTTTDVASTVVVWFDYEEEYCNGPNTTPKTLSGAEVVASYSPYDFTLLRFRSQPPPSYQPYYAGWDSNDNIKNSGFCIHHPNGEPKKLSITNQPIKSFGKKISWDEGTSSPENSNWEVSWDIGSTQQGSSGSPLFDNEKRIIGQLHGGNETADYFGKLAIAWKTQPFETKQLKKWLDPGSSGVMVCDAYIPPIAPEARFGVEFNNTCTDAPITVFDSSLFGATNWLCEFEPANQVTFFDNTTENSQNPRVSFTQAGIYDIYLTAGNRYGSDTRIEKGIINASLQIEPSITGIKTDTFICGCLLKKYPIVGNGASEYEYEVVENYDHFDILYLEDTMYLTLKDEFIEKGSFNTSIKLKAIHGICSNEISRNIEVLIPLNDNLADALELQDGNNGIFDNRCATSETNEPSPSANSCTRSNSWCPESSSLGNVTNSLWFKFEGPKSGTITIDAPGFDNQLAVYQADSYIDILNNQYELIAASDDQPNGDLYAVMRKIPVKPEMSYWVQLDGSKGGNTGNTNINFYNFNIEVLPNPSTGNITINVNSPQNQDIIINIYNLSGQEVYKTKIENSEKITTKNLSINLYSGIYILTVATDETIKTHKILIL
jgi:PKD repeat protein